MWNESARYDDGHGGRAGFERVVEQVTAYLRSRTADHWLMFAAGLVLGLLLG
jgi:hypothetical protein